MSLIKKKSGFPSIFRSGLLDDWFANERFFDSDFFKNDWVPAVNIAEKDQAYEVEIAIPGMKKEDISIHVDKGILEVSGETKTEKEEKDEKKYTRKEFSYTSFHRSFHLPENVDDTSIKAKYEEGILKLEIAKKANPSSTDKRSILVS